MKTMKILDKNIGEYFCDHGVDNFFLNGEK